MQECDETWVPCIDGVIPTRSIPAERKKANVLHIVTVPDNHNLEQLVVIVISNGRLFESRGR